MTALTAGAPLAIQAATSVVPVPLDWMVPIPGKNLYYLGYVHDSSTCVASTNGPDTRKSWLGTTKRGSATDANNGCFVWETLSYDDVNNVRVVVFGGGVWRHVFETTGTLVTWLDINPGNGQLVFCLWDKMYGGDTLGKDRSTGKPILGENNDHFRRVPVHHMDQVLYVSCGERPRQCKWHVNVVNGQPAGVVLKRKSVSTGSMGVSMPEKGTIMAIAKACGVNPDGSVLENYQTSRTTHAWVTSTVRALDPERLNPFQNRSLVGQNRTAQPTGAVPWEPSRAVEIPNPFNRSTPLVPTHTTSSPPPQPKRALAATDAFPDNKTTSQSKSAPPPPPSGVTDFWKEVGI